MSTDPLLRNRVHSYRYELLTKAGVYVSDLRIDDMSLDLNTESVLYANGNLRRVGLTTEDYRSSLIRIWYTMRGVPDRALATVIPRSPNERHTSASVQVNIAVYDRTLVMEGDSFGYTYGVPAGTNVITRVKALLASTGDTFQVQIDDAALTTSVDMTWGANDSKLTIANALLAAIRYTKLWTDEMGRWRAQPLVAPSAAAISWPLKGDSEGLYLPDFDRVRDLDGAPNRYIGSRQVTGSAPADRAVSVDAADYALRGYYVTETEADIPAINFATLQAIVADRLSKARQVASEVTVQHPVLPFKAGDVVTFQHRRLGEARAFVVRQTYPRRGLVSSVLREVV